MKIKFNFYDNFYKYEQVNLEEIDKLSFLLTNPRGDFLNLGLNGNSTKYQGFNTFDNLENSFFKIIDNISPKNLKLNSLVYEGFKVKREFESDLVEDLNDKVVVNDLFYLSENGVLVYEINNYEGIVGVDVDIRKFDDFSTWGREYNSYTKNGILYLEYIKKNTDDNSIDYKMYFGIKASNFDYNLVEKWIPKNYSYCKKRNSLSKLYVYNFINININSNKKIFLASGSSEAEIFEKINFVENNESILLERDMMDYDDKTKKVSFSSPVTENILSAYRISNYSINKFLRINSFDSTYIGLTAGYPWFNQVWSRDELIGLKYFIDNSNYSFVKSRIFHYLSLIDIKSGCIPILDVKSSNQSMDSVFWLSRRFMDLILKLDEKNILSDYFNTDDLNLIYNSLSMAFNHIIANSWDLDNELLKVKYAQSWMDTIEVEFPIDVQVQLLDFSSNLAFLSEILEKNSVTQKFLDFESLLKSKILDVYFRNNKLYQEANRDILSSNIFLVYYLYPDLFFKDTWEIIFDSALLELKTPYGFVSTLSNKSKDFQKDYTGENNLSYHMGDAWFWINNIAGICLNDLNSKKYRPVISKIISNSTNDILTMGTIGFASELSSASKFKAEGSLAQLWSSTTYIELVDKIFKKEN